MTYRLLSVSVAVALALATALPLAAQDGATRAPALHVQNADIRAFIQDVARTTGRTFIVDPGVTGTVTVTSDRPLSRAQLFEVFLSTLRANGLEPQELIATISSRLIVNKASMKMQHARIQALIDTLHAAVEQHQH